MAQPIGERLSAVERDMSHLRDMLAAHRIEAKEAADKAALERAAMTKQMKEVFDLLNKARGAWWAIGGMLFVAGALGATIYKMLSMQIGPK